jgi:menaquinone-specific isochorismate synthase
LGGVEADLEDRAWTDPLAVRTIAIADPGDLITRLPEPAAVAWVRRGEGLIGWGQAARITLPAGEDRFTVAEKWFRSLLDSAEVMDEVCVPGSGPVAFGSFSFDPTSDGSVLTVPRAVLGRRNGQAWLTTIGSPGEIGDPLPVVTPGQVRWHDGSLTAPGWERAVTAAVASIKAGRLRKVVLARDLYATAPEALDPRVLLHRLAARYPDCYTFACCGLVGATPELLVRREAAEISALVLAGTSPRGKDAASDQALGAALLSSAKDIEEHVYAVAGVRESLTPLCERLAVDASPFLLKLANVQHLATAVTGTLAPQRDRGTGNSRGAGPSWPDGHVVAAPGAAPSSLAVAAALHPTAAVCGTPTDTAMELIRELEGMDRGRYAGPVGWLDARGNGEWGIAMRCAEIDGARARLFAGCGIVAGSDPAAELAEAQAKFRPMQDALEGRD